MTSDKTEGPLWRSRSLKNPFLLISLVFAGVVVFSLPALFATAPDVENWVSVRHESLVHHIGLAGKIEPHKTIVLTAPFEGNVRSILVEPGQTVDQGQVLLTMDSALIDMQMRDAESMLLKAQRIEQDLKDWENSAQVMRARRAVRTAEMSENNLQRRLRDSQLLLERGIIPRNELDDLNQQLQMQTIERLAAQDELQHILAQGTGEHRRIAEMELKNATVKFEGLRMLRDGQNVIAPFNGVVMPVTHSRLPGAHSNGPLQAGTRVNQGQVILGLANIEQLKIVTSASELDINQLHSGQEVEIEGDGFAGDRLKGSVQIVSSLAEPNDEASGSAKFSLTITLPTLTPEQLQRIRLGMSARVTIITARNEQAIVIPAKAARQEGLAWRVNFRPAMDQPIRQIPITVGRPTLNGIEVFGLSPGFVHVPD